MSPLHSVAAQAETLAASFWSHTITQGSVTQATFPLSSFGCVPSGIKTFAVVTNFPTELLPSTDIFESSPPATTSPWPLLSGTVTNSGT